MSSITVRLSTPNSPRHTLTLRTSLPAPLVSDLRQARNLKRQRRAPTQNKNPPTEVSEEPYFSLFISPRDVLFATIKAVVFFFISSTIQSYYGFFATGGPVGVGVAAGRAMRASVTVVMIVNMLLTMGLWGVEAGARFGG